MNAENITPEMAAFIVKKYVLPMFESKERKALKSKYNRMTSIGANTGQNLKYIVPRAEDFQMPGVKNQGTAPQGTVYGELKLSEKLSEELNVVKTMVDRYKEELEEANYYRHLYKMEVEELKNQLTKLRAEVKLYKTDLIE